MKRAHKIQMHPNNKQATLLKKTCGCNRFAYNWMLNAAVEAYKQGTKYNKNALKKAFNAFKKSLPWMKEVNAHAVVNDAIDKLGNAYNGFFEGKANHPRFRSKRSGVGTFSLPGSEIKYDAKRHRVYIGRIGWIRMAESIRFEYTRLYRVTVSSVAGRWFASFTLEIDDNRRCENQTSSVGVDLGISKLATCSDGVVYENPRVSNRFQKRLRKLNKEMSRRTEGGRNWNKTVNKLRKLHFRISSIRADLIHKMTSEISRKHGVVCLEDLNVSGMAKNRHLARHVADAAFSEIRRQFAYKALDVRFVSRYTATSQLCSCCGHRQAMPLNIRLFECCECGLVIDRDMNAAVNIKILSASSAGVEKPVVQKPMANRKRVAKASAGQESNTVCTSNG